MQFKIINCRPFSDGFLGYFISVIFKLIHFHVCVFEEEINNKKKHDFVLFSSFFFVWILTFVLDGDRIIPLNTSFYLNQ